LFRYLNLLKDRMEMTYMFRGLLGGASFGSMIAITISWSVNKSIAWTILHGIFSWFYVFYYALGYGH